MNSQRYVAGGGVQAGGGIYVTRPADEELLVLCRNRAFVYVLTSRQVGKTSLITNASTVLAGEGIRCAIVDLTEVGVTGVSADQWYVGFLFSIAEQASVDIDIGSWWAARREIPPTQRLLLFFREVLLARIADPFIVFVDEVESTRSLSFADDFYAAIRAIYNSRSRVPEYQRLSFVLLGSSAPTDLIQDPRRTPFNIGTRVHLTDFTLEEASQLGAALPLSSEVARRVLEWVLGWTGGHPYLTQRLLYAISESESKNPGPWTVGRVDDIVFSVFLARRDDDNNLRFVRDMLTSRSPDLLGVLSIYRDAYQNRIVVTDDDQSNLKTHLKLSGALVAKDGRLRVRNEIYNRAFDSSWIRSNLPVNWPRRLQQSAATLAGVFVLVLIGQVVVVSQSEKKARASEAKATDSENKAKASEETAIKARDAAEELARSEARARNEAELSALKEKLATEKLKVANKGLLEAKREAERAGLRARAEADLARVQAELALRRRAEADSLRNAAVAGRLAVQSESLAKEQPETSVLLAVQALKRGPSFESDRAMRTGLGRLPSLELRPVPIGPPIAGGNVVAFSPDGEQIAYGFEDGVRIQRLLSKTGGFSPGDTDASQTDKRRFGCAAGEVTQLSFSPSGAQILLTCRESKDVYFVDVLDLGAAKVLFHLGPYTRAVGAIYTPDQKWLLVASGGYLEWFRNRSVDTIEHGAERPLPVAKAEIVPAPSGAPALAITTDGRFVAVGTSGVGLLDIEQFVAVSALPSRGEIRDLAFSPDGLTLARLTQGSVVLTDLESASDRRAIATEKDATLLRFSPDGRFVVTAGGADRGAVLWDVATGSRRSELQASQRIVSLGYSRRGEYLATATAARPGADGSILVWDMSGSRNVAALPGGWSYRVESPVTALVFSPDAKALTVGRLDGLVQHLEPESGSGSLESRRSDGAVVSLSYSHDGTLFACGRQDGSIEIRETRVPGGDVWLDRNVDGSRPPSAVAGLTPGPGNSGFLFLQAPLVSRWRRGLTELTDVFVARNSKVVAFTPDAAVAYVGGETGDIGVWSMKMGKKVAEIPFGVNVEVRAVAISPDGMTLAGAGSDGLIRFWELGTGEELKPERVKRHSAAVTSLAFTSDGRFLASGSADRTVRIWDVRSGVEVARLASDATVNTVAFSGFNGDRYLATGGLDQFVRIWLWKPTDLISDACSRLTRDLSKVEWIQYLGSENYEPSCSNLPVPDR